MTRKLLIGESIATTDLDKVIKSLRVTVQWTLLADLKNPPEADVFCFLLDKNGQAPDNADFLFYNQLDGLDNAAHVVLDDNIPPAQGGKQSIVLALDAIRYTIVQAQIGLSLYRAGERDQSFRYVDNVTVQLINEGTGDLLAEHVIDGKAYKDAVCLTLIRFDRDGQWSLTAAADGHTTFDDLARQHGIVVAGG